MLDESLKTIRNGEVVEGAIIDVKEDEIILNISISANSPVLANFCKEIALAENIKDFKENQLPYVMDIMARYMDERIRFEVEESGFFECNFLA